MPQLLGFILLIALIGLAFKLLVVALIVAFVVGLIWRPKETMGAFLFLFILGMISTYPWIALGTAIFGAIGAYYNHKREKMAKATAPDEPPPQQVTEEELAKHTD